MHVARNFRTITLRLRTLFRRNRVEQELDEEMQYHLERQIEQNVAGGMSAKEARYSALRSFGGIDQHKEVSRDTRRTRWISDLIDDMRYGLRVLRVNPRFAAVAIATAALGISATTTIFSMVSPLLFKPLPYPEPDRLVRVYRTTPQSQEWPHSIASFLEHRKQNSVFDRLTAVNWMNVSFSAPEEPAQRLTAMVTTADFFPALDVQPMLGRVFAEADDRDGADPVVVLSYRFWQSKFAGDSAIIGRSVRLDGREAKVIGVMPENFDNPFLWGPVDLWRPFAFTPAQLADRSVNFLGEFGRLKHAISMAQARLSMAALGDRLWTEHGSADHKESLRLVGLQQTAGGADVTRQMSGLTLGLVVFVLLIACVNLANLQLARSTIRAREFAVRCALGCSNARLVRQTLTESLLIAVTGAGISLPMSYWMIQIIARSRMFTSMPGLVISLDRNSLIFAMAVSVVTGLVFGMLPAWLVARSDFHEMLKQGLRNAPPGRAQHRVRRGLIVTEIAFALVLLTGAAILIRGMQHIGNADPGWNPRGLLFATVDLNGANYSTPRARADFFERMQERLAGMPGVDKAALSTSIPAEPFGNSGTFQIEGRQEAPFVAFNDGVSPDYFATAGIRLLRGRTFTPADQFDGDRVTVINETMARRLWPNADPIGKRFALAGPNPIWREVVGVVEKIDFPGNVGPVDTDLQAYRPLTQFVREFRGAGQQVHIELRTAGAPESLARGLRQIVADLDQDLPVWDIRTAEDEIDLALSGVQLVRNLLGSFALLAVVLAAIGVFGVISYSVAQRTGEIGIRVALGAQRPEVLWMVLRAGLKLTAIGTLWGLAGSFGLAMFLVSIVPALSVADPAVLFGPAAILIAVSLAACYIPARRAAQIDPMSALRHE